VARLGLSGGSEEGSLVVARFALHSGLRQSGRDLPARVVYGTAEAVPLRGLSGWPWALVVDW
jgi:hypothetical protein